MTVTYFMAPTLLTVKLCLHQTQDFLTAVHRNQIVDEIADIIEGTRQLKDDSRSID